MTGQAGRSRRKRVLCAIAPYGLGLPSAPAGPPELEREARCLIDRVGDLGGVVLVTGPSGAGKSSLVRAAARLLDRREGGVVRAGSVRIAGDVPVAGMAGRLPLDEWLAILSRSGLADARLFATRSGYLSAGESARLRLACAIARVEQRSHGGGAPWLICDEFCSVLDRDTAAGVASALRRWATASGARVIVASAHADMVRMLGADWVVRVSRGIGARVERGTSRARGPRVLVERGTADDYRALARFHYRVSAPASACRVLRAVVPGDSGPRLAGVLVVSHPTLNGAWRALAWPGRYTPSPGTHAACAGRLNREVRRISRVIVDPRDRGRGIARRLVRAYLDDPVTPATEAVSAMGRLSPFGRSAGMREYALPPRAADDRLADMLDAMGVAPWELLDAPRVVGIKASRDGAWLVRELGVWARAVRASVPKPLRDAGDAFVFAPLAAGRLCAPPRAYAHVV